MSNPWKESFEDLRSSIEQVYEEQQSAEANVIKKARQLAYDIRYEVKKSFGKDGNLDAAAIKRAYLQKLSKSPASGPVKLKAKQMLVGVKEDFDLLGEEEKQLYRVTDAETKHSYTRKATKEKAEELRRNPKIAAVEKTAYGEPYEGKYKKSGKNTVGDADGDGTKEDDSHEYAGVKDRAIKKSMAKKESFSNWREEMGENFFFESLNEKVLPSSPYCDVMPEEQSGNKKDIQKSAQNQKLLKMKEDLNLLAEELGGEVVDIQEYAAAVRALPAISRILKTGGLKGFRVPVKPPHLPRAPKLPTPKTTPAPSPKPFPKPAPTEPAPKPVPQPKPEKPVPQPKPGKPTKPEKPGKPTKPERKPEKPVKPEPKKKPTERGGVVVPAPKEGSKPSKTPEPTATPSPKKTPQTTPVIPGTPGGGGRGPGGSGGVRLPRPKCTKAMELLGLCKIKEPSREIGIVKARGLT